jgi:D-3-phosphoglycerate dehydrogenase / 2-oxoglutarate reductase
VLSVSSEEPVSYVNAPQVLRDRGAEVRESKTSTAHDYVNLIVVRSEEHSVGGTLFGLKGEARIVLVDDHATEVPISKNMLVVRNDDRPGIIGAVGIALGEAGINISDIHVGRSAGGDSALMVVAVDSVASDDIVGALRGIDGVVSVHPITLA